MKFKRMAVSNWRMYRGNHEFDFSTTNDKPVTLIFCENGGGKTALLNAFTWLLYEHFTPGFRRKDDLINHYNLDKDPGCLAEIELEIEEDETVYTINRTVSKAQQAAGTSDLTIHKNGQLALSYEIERLLPKQLKDLFFIQGEGSASRNIMAEADSDAIQITNVDSINSLFGLTVYDEIIDHLRKAKDKIKRPRSHKQSTMDKYAEEADQLESQLDDVENDIRINRAYVKQTREKIQAQEDVVKSYGEAGSPEYRDKIKAFDDSLDKIEKHSSEAKRLYTNYANHLKYHLPNKFVTSAIEKLDSAKRYELMPSKIDSSTLEESLEDEKCHVCQQDLSDDARLRVQELLDITTNQGDGIQGNIILANLKAYTNTENEKLDDLHRDLARLMETVELNFEPKCPTSKIPQYIQILFGSLKDGALQVKSLRNRFLEINANGEEAAIDIKKLANLQSAENDYQITLNRLSNKKSKLETEYGEAKGKYENAAKGQKQHLVAIKAKNSLVKAISHLEKVKQLISKYARQDLSTELSDAYRALTQIKSERTVELNENYTLQSREGGTLTDMGGAENNIAQLAFIAAIARVAPFYKRLSTEPYLKPQIGKFKYDGENAIPVVFDAIASPFGDHFAKTVINEIPNLLPQIILPTYLSNLTQWESIKDKIGAVYCVTLNLHKNDDPNAVQHIRWAGLDHEYVRIDETEEMESYSNVVKLG